MDQPDYLRRADAASYLKSHYGFGTVNVLAKLAWSGDGPEYRMIGRWPVYTTADLDAWAQSRMSAPNRSTAAHGADRQRATA